MSRQNVMEGVAWVCGDCTDTYKILPQDYWMGGDNASRLDPDELGSHAMEGIDASFANAARAGKYQFIVAGKNFGGGGKSIEHPIIAIKGAFIKVVLAESVSRYFFRNAINNGLPILTLDGISRKIKTGDELEINLDTGEIHNQSTGEDFKAQPVPSFVQEILAKGGYINYTKERLAKHV